RFARVFGSIDEIPARRARVELADREGRIIAIALVKPGHAAPSRFEGYGLKAGLQSAAMIVAEGDCVAALDSR
ncbi:MAG: hypothetical protein WD076_06290, partial [Parvularculaceae bacterium]